MSAGSIGENVKVYYAATKKTLSATVTGAGQVEVRL
jgi:flagella basal body P-ring formation protein FlgA